jgi:enoyl-CoA hydratase/carnithine racemase
MGLTSAASVIGWNHSAFCLNLSSSRGYAWQMRPTKLVDGVSMTQLVQMSLADDVAIITLNAPERRNAISLEMREEAISLILECVNDKNVSAMVLTGAGASFCAGGDISHLSSTTYEPDPLRSWTKIGQLHNLIRLLATAPKVIVAAVEGHAYGAGLSLALACDWVVAARGAIFCSAFSRLGLIADAGLMWSLPPRVGPGHAKDILFTGRSVSGAEAYSLGLSDTLVEDGEVVAAATVKARELGKAPPLVVAATKAIFAAGPESLDRVMHSERIMQPMITLSDDHAEARAARAERRAPDFRAR